MIFNHSDIKHVAIYLRRSRDEEGLGIEEVLKAHESMLVAMCKKNNYSYEIFKEIASSSSIENRPQMVKLLKRIKEYHFDGIVVADIDRLSRNEFDSSDIKRILFETGTYILTPNRLYDLRKDDDSLLMGVSSLIASQEYKAIHRRMRRGKQYHQQEGKWTDGSPPLGYDKDSKTRKLVPNVRSSDVKFIFQEIANGTTIPELVRLLKQMGKRTRQNADFHYNAILRIVNNEAYKGTVISNRQVGKHGANRPREEWIIVENAHEAIIDSDIWEKANQIVNEYSFKAPRSKNRIYPTTGLIYCANCGKTQGANYHPHIDKYYVKHCSCGNRGFFYNAVLQKIREEVLEQKQTIIIAITELEEGTKENDTKEYRREQLTAQLRKSEKALEKIQIQYEEDEIDISTYRQRKNARQEQIKELKNSLEALKLEDTTNRIVNLQEQLQALSKLFDKWFWLDGLGLSDEEVNRLLHHLISGILWRYPKGSNEPILEIVYKH